MSGWQWTHLEALFPMDTWDSGHFIPVGTPRKRKLLKILSGTLQGMAVTLWKVFKQSFKFHSLQFHHCIWDKPWWDCWQERDSLTFRVPCWARPPPQRATQWSGQGAHLVHNQPTPMCILVFFSVKAAFEPGRLTMQTQKLQKLPVQEGQVRQLTPFSKRCYPGQFKMIMKQQPEICLKLLLSDYHARCFLAAVSTEENLRELYECSEWC